MKKPLIELEARYFLNGVRMLFLKKDAGDHAQCENPVSGRYRGFKFLEVAPTDRRTHPDLAQAVLDDINANCFLLHEAHYESRKPRQIMIEFYDNPALYLE